MKSHCILRGLLVVASVHLPYLAEAADTPERPAPTAFQQEVIARMKHATMPGPFNRKLEVLPASSASR
ncbi:hypothetical protein [Pseudoduganella umbonata]|uniref:Uncharacterized protein n=1 Tax=Pseudoduganella umbonata TaxID=864828 RepID=A0A4P8HX03_9BURK|nr:hypothetical protein [Pseudoduganella umbonata]MBB3224206.1 hypothetical protein [Pseudoduganella umbonata]QCP13936.1 hypothetical protein FCL38_28625 [Pseudoduganella umbonata]